MPRGRRKATANPAQPSLSPTMALPAAARQPRFDESLVLFRYILSLFGRKSLESLCEGMKDERWEGWDEQNISNYYHYLTTQLFDFPGVTKDDLLRYDNNITSHTRQLSAKRPGFHWKYFQYMALLFTEIYLDKYFSNSEKFLADLNTELDKVNEALGERNKLPPYTLEDLNKIAYWQATGSGKTLIMHVNLLQYRHYLDKANKLGSINRTILLTPNEGLSAQHNEEFALSSIQADLFVKDGQSLYSSTALEIIDIHKLAEESKEKTVSVDSFENNNLVLVDEGHRGAGGDEWMDKRNRLCEKGFSFEYSATFGQAVKAANRKSMFEQYAKCILFDYSYKYFYRDGYGKEYSILNLADTLYDAQYQLYLTACLLTFYQQLKIHKAKAKELAPFNVEEPLWVFVGSKVNAVRKEEGLEVSDVTAILAFLREFLKQKDAAVADISRLLSGTSQLNDTRGNDLFTDKFNYLAKERLTPEQIYSDIVSVVFNCKTPGAQLHIDNLKGVQGEIGLRVGDSEYFGVINVGDDGKLIKLCEENKFNTSDKDFSDSLFRRLAFSDSPVKLLIGSKKFTEGWNSWRVSTMGLMNVGRSEGSEIIQLFGRGVRLKGYKGMLKRSRFSGAPAIPNEIGPVETLNIFGVKADYMKKFREYLEDEGVKGVDEQEVIQIPCIRNFDSVKLKYPQLKAGINFKKDGPKPDLSEPNKFLLERPVILNWYPKVEALQAKGLGQARAAVYSEGKLGKEHISFLDYDQLYFEIQKYKNERCYYNLNISLDIIQKLLSREDWYKLYIPKEELEFTVFSRVKEWQEIAVALLKKYCDNYYAMQQMDYEKDKLEYRYLDEVETELRVNGKEGNLFDEYKFLVEKSRQDIIEKVKVLKGKIQAGDFADMAIANSMSFAFERHLYKPLVHVKDSELQVLPVALNDGEKDFVTHLRTYYTANKAKFANKDIYLLRNRGKGRGVGFFQAHNFYPDFIMWAVEGKKQKITFVDPHGLRMVQAGFNDPKINFHKEVKVLEKQIGDADVTLASYIVSVTPFSQIGLWDASLKQADFEANNVLFQEQSGGYIAKLF